MPPDDDGGVSKDAWLWQNKAFSDVTLLVYPAGDGSDGASTAENKPEPLAKLPLHSVVLASASPEHYRCHLLRLWQDGAEEQPAAKRAKVAGTQHAANVLELTCYPGEPEAVPEAVLHHAYTGILPDDAALLAWMIWRADYLDMHATVKACLAKLRAMADGGKLTVQDLIVISSLPALQTGSSEAVQKQVTQIAGKVLASQLGVAHEVVGDQQLLEQFVQLPFQLLKQWGTLESIEVDSENTVAVLITAWYDHHLTSTPPASAPTAQQCKELSALLCLDKLSPSFHLQALPHLKWYRPPEDLPSGHALVRVLAGLNPAASDAGYRALLAAGGVVRKAAEDGNVTSTVSRQDLQALWKHGILQIDTIYYAGYCFQATLELDETAPEVGITAGREVGLFLTLQWPTVLSRHGVRTPTQPKPVTAATVECEVTVKGTTYTKTDVHVISQDRRAGWGNVFGDLSFATFEELVAVSMPAANTGQAADQADLSFHLSFTGIQ